MPQKPKIGLLPLYIALYDKVRPEARDDFEPFLRQIADGFAGEGIDVVRSNICCATLSLLIGKYLNNNSVQSIFLGILNTLNATISSEVNVCQDEL